MIGFAVCIGAAETFARFAQP
ncbi:MAG: hypothetical protein QOH00_3488, partial [Gaiellales bacterium]|nr:hypothetical protein [Gaiellales bacterium]